MTENAFMPEGSIIYTKENLSYISSIAGLQRAMSEGRILEAEVLSCDSELDLHLDIPCADAVIPRCECVLTRDGESAKDIAIITRVGKPVCFKVVSIETNGVGRPRVTLSRRLAQLECRNLLLSELLPGDIIPATVTHLDSFGAFVDIGCGIASLLSIDCISVSRIEHPSARLFEGQRIYVIVRSNDKESGRIYVTLKELLGTWEENASAFSPSHTVGGIVRSIESYGVFIELAPNLAGLAEVRERDPLASRIAVGDSVSVYIKSIIPDRMKIKLVLIDINHSRPLTPPLKYFIDPERTRHLSRWQYSPPSCPRVIETVFDGQ